MNTLFQKIVSFFGWIKNAFIKISQVFSKKEKIIIISAVIILICTGSLMLYDNWIKNTHEVAQYGGNYTEGIVAESEEELTDVINRLTKIGLTKFDKDGNIVGEVAQSWEVSDDIKQFRFKIRSEFSRDDVLKELEKQKDIWADIKISAKDNDKIVFDLAETFSPFLATTTKPVLPYGPFTIDQKENSELTLYANEDFYLGRPYLDKIILKVYPDEENLYMAYKTKEIDGVFDANTEYNFNNFNIYKFKLPRYNIVFFNTDREVLKNKETRKKIANNEQLDNEVNLAIVVLDNQKNREIVENLISKWKDLNVNSKVFYKDSTQIIDQIIPSRDYDVLVYGLNYGYDPDPYPFWHSTQSGEAGLNLSNYSNIDADVALEEARKTLNTDTRKEKYAEFWKIFEDETPAIIVSQDEWIFALNKNIKGVQTGYSIGPEDQFVNIFKWYIKTKREKN